jgi:hypothetical protein
MLGSAVWFPACGVSRQPSLDFGNIGGESFGQSTTIHRCDRRTLADGAVEHFAHQLRHGEPAFGRQGLKP